MKITNTIHTEAMTYGVCQRSNDDDDVGDANTMQSPGVCSVNWKKEEIFGAASC